MNIENLVVSLETAKLLKEKGWIKPTAFNWSLAMGEMTIVEEYQTLNEGTDYISAPTAQEILQELPPRIIVGETQYWLEIQRKFSEWLMVYSYTDWDNCEFCWLHSKYFQTESLSEAAAQLWIWCKENGYLEGKK